MKHFLLVFTCLLSGLSSEADVKNKPVDLTGNWKEAGRISPRNERLDFTDTTFYDFLIGNEYTVQRKHSFMYRGTYKATKGMLDLGMRTYNVLEMAPERIVLKDDAGSYEFVRYNKAARMAENSDAASSGKRAYQDDLNPAPVRASQLAGKWEVYKRTSNTTLPEIDYTRIISMIDIKPEGGKMGGSVASAKDMETVPSWKITGYNNGVIYCSGKGDRQLKVLRCDDGELIIQEDNITYFFKQFK